MAKNSNNDEAWNKQLEYMWKLENNRMNNEIKKISKADKKLLDKIEHILASELSCKEYDSFYDYFNEIRKPNIIVDIKDDENIKDYITNLQEELEEQKRIEQADFKTIQNLEEELKEYKMIFDAFSKRPYAHRYLEEKKKELGNNKIIGLDSEMIYKDYYDLKEENERLHKELDYAINDNIYYIAKIDKAIEYIKLLEGDYDLELSNGVEYKLLNILKGSDEE